MPLKVITIDFWNTLFDSSNGFERNKIRLNAFNNGIKTLGLDLGENHFNEAIQASWQFFNRNWKEDYRTPSTQETIDFFCNYLNIPNDLSFKSKLIKAFSEAVLLAPPKLIDDVKESLKILHKKYTLGIISDTGFSPGLILKELLKQNNILDYFSAFSFSDETGVSKPHPKAYYCILEKFNCIPSEALHIGDIENTDIIGAKRIGMKAIKFSGDETALFRNDKTQRTAADAECFSWKEIINLINTLEQETC